MHINLKNEHWAFVSTETADRNKIRFAIGAVLVSALIFLVAAPFAKVPLTQVPAFIPIYVSSLVLSDLITAALLFGQFSVLRSVSLLVMAGGYFFTASITAAYALIFPGLFSPSGLFGAGSQTTSAMYMFWHGGFPLVVIAYALIKNKEHKAPVPSSPLRANAHVTIVSTITLILAIVLGFTLFATRGHAYIPEFLHGNLTTDTGRIFLFSIWMLSLLALLTLWRRRPFTVLDVWLLVVMCVWLFDIALSAILNTGRYDLGWYVGRIYGLLAASFLLIVLLIEDSRQYARLVQMSIELSTANKALEKLSRHDGLTEVANRRFFDEYLGDQIAITRRHQRPLALVLCDVDHFKAYNDHYGHQSGDVCLKQVAAALQSCCQRPADMAARYGGEEFALILPDTDLNGAIQIAEATRKAVTHLEIPHEHSSAGPVVSISCGVALLLNSDMTAAQLIAAADQCLYQAKALGRNRVVCAEPNVLNFAPKRKISTAAEVANLAQACEARDG